MRAFGGISYGTRLWFYKLDRCCGYWGLYLHAPDAERNVCRQQQPTATVDLIGVKNDLLAIAQAERSHQAAQGSYVSIESLRSQGDLTMTRDNRGPYNYSAEISDGSFRIVATYSGPESSGMPQTLSVDQTMQVSQQ